MQCSSPCPLYPRKRTCAVQLGMSALGQKWHRVTFKFCLLAKWFGLSCIVGGRPRRRTHLGRILRGRPSFLFFLYGALRTVPSASLARHKMVIVPCRNSSAGPRLCTTGGVSMCDYSLHDVAS